MSETLPHRYRTYETADRFSLNNGVVEKDFHTGQGRREVIYTQGNPEHEATRHILEKHGIILGRSVEGAPGHVTYDIPESARPLALEASVVVAQGPLSYSDDAMMYDLGELTSRINDLTGCVVAGPAAETAFALVDFVPSDAPQLYAAPGLEQILVKPNEDEDLLSVQMQAFSEIFGDQYRQNVSAFVDGYHNRG